MGRTCGIYVISLAGSARRSPFSRRAKTELPWQFFDAHDTIAPPLSYSPREAMRVHGRELRDSELGCFSSHYALWCLSAREERNIVVLEDDLYVDWNFISALLREVGRRKDIGYLRLYAKCPCRFRLV